MANATLYVDPAATGAADGSSWTDAYTDLQTAVNAVSGTGNTINCRGTQTLTSGGTATIDFTSAPNGAVGAYNKIIGHNASGVNDGTRFVLDGNNANGSDVAGITWKTSTYWWVENVEVKRCQGNGFGGSSAYGVSWFLKNCKAANNGSYGFNGNSTTSSNRFFYKCIASNNGNSGYYNCRGSRHYFGVSHSNTGRGFNGSSEEFYGCLAYDNTSEGFYIYAGGCYNCVSDDNGVLSAHDGFLMAYPVSVVTGCRSTNNAGYGIGGDSTMLRFSFLNFTDDNTTGEIESTTGDVSIDNVTTGTVGYADRTNKDFNLTDSATLRRLAVTLPT